MGRLVDICAPRTLWDAILRGAVFLTLILAVNWAVSRAGGGPFRLGADLMFAALTALPFVALVMGLLLHMRRLQHKLLMLATTDVLTGLPNRRAFLGRMEEMRATGRDGALLLLDADHFKRINDTFGHAVGDACLIAIAERIRAAARPGDLAGRLGGEEFSMFLPETALEEARLIGARLCTPIEVEPPAAAGPATRPVRVTLSAGLAFGHAATPLERLLAQADEALYQAKATGRARVVIWHEVEPEAPPGTQRLRA